MSPGISVRPLPWIRCTVVPGGSAIGALEILLITLPITSTFEAPDSRSDLPSKIRTFSNTTAGDGGACATAASATAVTITTLIRILRRACIHTPTEKSGRTRSGPGGTSTAPAVITGFPPGGVAILRLGYAGRQPGMRKASHARTPATESWRSALEHA